MVHGPSKLLNFGCFVEEVPCESPQLFASPSSPQATPRPHTWLLIELTLKGVAFSFLFFSFLFFSFLFFSFLFFSFLFFSFLFFSFLFFSFLSFSFHKLAAAYPLVTWIWKQRRPPIKAANLASVCLPQPPTPTSMVLPLGWASTRAMLQMC